MGVPSVEPPGGTPTYANMDSVGHPSPVERHDKWPKEDLEWKYIGSGTFARTFPQAERLKTWSKGGPSQKDVYKRVVRSLSSGKILDECIIDDVPDEILHRRLALPENIRVELIMKGALKMFEAKGSDGPEIFSQPRVAQEAALRDYGGVKLVPGWGLDLTREDPLTGEPWDLSKCAVRERVMKLARETAPFLVIGSPPCTMFSTLQNLSKKQRNKVAFDKAMKNAKEHVKSCVEIYKMQMCAGRYFLHEHPNSASSWNMPEVADMVAHADVDVVTCDMCAYGLKVTDKIGEALVEKRTRLMSNSPEIIKRVGLQCGHRTAQDTGEMHRHADTTCGRA
jgi:hypothetical protein